jgi:MFS family permease
MMKRMFPTALSNNSRHTLANIVLVSNAFVWYFFAITILIDIVGKNNFDSLTTILIWSLHFAGISISAIVGALVVNKIKDRTMFLNLWMILGILSSVALFALDLTFIPTFLAISLILGVSLGLGMPCCMGYFTESIGIEKRGRVGGVILLLSGVGMAALGAVTSGNVNLESATLLGWRAFGLISFFFLVHNSTNCEKKNKVQVPSYKSLIFQRSFILYLVPWIMFSLITYLTGPIQADIIGISTVDSLKIIENALTGVFALAGGFLVDIIGRKRVAIAGFAMLGLSYSVLGIFPRALESWYFYTVVDGVAWGMLYVLFVITIWGDLSNGAASDKYYALGVLPFFISKFFQLTIGGDIVAAIPDAIFSFTAFFLFLAVLPLVYAPETLPEKVMIDRDLKSYVEKAKKKVQTEEEKNQKLGQKKPAEAALEFQVQTEEKDKEYEEAEQLAEKYY